MCGKRICIGFNSTTSIHSQNMADTGITDVNLTGATIVAANFNSANIPLGIAPAGTITVTPCLYEWNTPPLSSNILTSVEPIKYSLSTGDVVEKIATTIYKSNKLITWLLSDIQCVQIHVSVLHENIIAMCIHNHIYINTNYIYS